MGKTYRKAIVLVQDGGGNDRGNVICVGNGLTAWGKAKRKAERKRSRQNAKAEASYDHMMMLADERQDAHDAMVAELELEFDNYDCGCGCDDYYDPRDHDDEPELSWYDMDDPGEWEDYGYADGYYSRRGFTALETTPAPYGDDAGESLGDILARALRSKRENHL